MHAGMVDKADEHVEMAPDPDEDDLDDLDGMLQRMHMDLTKARRSSIVLITML